MKYKTVFMQLEPVFLPNIQRKLEAMAMKGWILDEIGTYSMLFKKIEPQYLKYNILINPVNEFKELNNGPSGELEELCIADGWEYVLRRSAYVVFINRHNLNTPIYSDPKNMNDQIKKRVKNSLFIYACFAMLIALFFMPIAGSFNYMSYYQPVTVSFLLWSIALFIEACLSFIPSLVWLGVTNNKSDETIFEMPDYIYTTSSNLRFVSSLIFIFASTCLSFLRPIGNLNTIFLWAAIIFVLITMFIGFRNKEGRYVFILGKDILIKGGITLLIFSFIGFGGINYLTRDIFSTDRSLRLTDFKSSETISQTYNSPSIGLFAIKTTGYTEIGKSDYVSTSIIRFYSKEKMDEYWLGQTKALDVKSKIDSTIGLKGYYIGDKSGMILRTKNEVIEINSNYDLLQANNIKIIKNRLRLTSIDFESLSFD